MQDNSYMYNLSNPALHRDLGEANMNMMMPNPAMCGGMGFIPGVTGTMADVHVQGSLRNDTYQETRQQKDSKNYKKIFITAGLIIAGVLCFKGGKNLFGKIGEFCKKLKK